MRLSSEDDGTTIDRRRPWGFARSGPDVLNAISLVWARGQQAYQGVNEWKL